MFIRTLLINLIILVPCQTQVMSRTEDSKRISITVPAAPWSLTLPGDNLTIEGQQVKPDGRNGYFLMSDSKNKMMISMFIEPAVECKSSKECRDMVWKAGNPSWENPQNVVLSEIGDVSFFEFFMPSRQGVPVQQQNMYAQFVRDGFWVDLHVSKVLYKPKEHELFERLVKSINFEPKYESVVRAEDAPKIAAQKALEAWLVLWDSGKWEESYKELAELARRSTTERHWFITWSGVRKPLGRVRSRKLLDAEHMKPLSASRPDQEGAVLRYESSFENRKSIVELFGLIRETDGTWRVLSYITP
jgi:hypothetical protein